MRRLGLALALVLALAAPAQARFHRVDCDTGGHGVQGFVENWLVHNGRTLFAIGRITAVALGQFLAGIGAANDMSTAMGSLDFTDPRVRFRFGVDFIGAGIGYGRSALQSGGTATGAFNAVFGIFCHEWRWEQPPPGLTIEMSRHGIDVDVGPAIGGRP